MTIEFQFYQYVVCSINPVISLIKFTVFNSSITAFSEPTLQVIMTYTMLIKNHLNHFSETSSTHQESKISIFDQLFFMIILDMNNIKKMKNFEFA